MTEKTVLRKELGAEAKGKQFIVMNNEDSDFPKGSVVTCMDRYGERFNSESETYAYMYSNVLLKPAEKEIIIKVGDRVKLVSERPGTWNIEGMMDEFLGSIQIVKSVEGRNVNFENSSTHTWAFQTKDVAEVLPNTLTFTELADKLPELEIGTEFKANHGSILYVGTQQNPVNKHNKFFYWKSDGKPVSVTEVTVGATYTELEKEPAKPEFTEIDWKEAFQIVVDGGTVYVDDEKTEVGKYTDIEMEIECEDLSDLLIATNWFKKTE